VRTIYYDNELIIRLIEEKDLFRLWELIYKDKQPEWKKWDAPYFPHHTMPFEQFLLQKNEWVHCPSFFIIEIYGEICGTVSYYWEDEASSWLEMGIILYQPQSWNRGIGTRALKLWMDHLFHTLPLVRVGLTTWSGNERMIHVGYKLGMQLEARIRKVRLYNGVYYDSIRMGILREEWEKRYIN